MVTNGLTAREPLEEEFVSLTAWAASVSPKLPLHISRYFPAHAYGAPPTDMALLKRFQSLASERLQHVHLGNAPLGQ
ncbi:MAG: hypothetical protein LBS31_03685 [Candidatus Adiutrix sp.]|nr:hypothetical protein [Candidatus Adiutrix sp.]